MTRLLIHDGTVAPDAPVLRTGGLPLTPPGSSWPTCRTCSGAMQFLAHLPLERPDAAAATPSGGAVAVFMCQNDPGLCEEWDPTSGGNSASVVSGNLVPASPPATGVTLLSVVSAARVEEVEDAPYGDARMAWAARHGGSPRQVLGSLGGEPDWLQGDETPTCGPCGGPMPFLAHLEEGSDYATAINFGGGAGFVFACPVHERAALLFQC